MEFHMLVKILTEALKIFRINGKLMASFALLSLSLYSILYLFNFFSIKSVMEKWIVNQSLLLLLSINSPEYANLVVLLYNDTIIFFGVEWILLLLSSIIFFFFSTSTILASAKSQCGQVISLKDLLSQTTRSLKRPFITLLYITMFDIGYIFLVLIILLPPMMVFQHPFGLKALYTLLWVSAIAFNACLAVVWNLGLVISVLEESYYGIEALGKAAKIVNGMELHGFLVNLLITMLSFIVLSLFSFTEFSAVQMMIGLLILNCIWLVRMFGLMAYTVLYYQCKKNHGEEVELQGSLEFGGITNLPLFSGNIP